MNSVEIDFARRRDIAAGEAIGFPPADLLI